MKEIKILGTGCPKCEKLTELTRRATAEMGLECNLEKVSDITEIIKFKVMMTPALVIDGEVKMVGKVPPIDEIKALLAEGE